MNVYSEDVVSEKVKSIGYITLNRPKALNALSLPMVLIFWGLPLQRRCDRHQIFFVFKEFSLPCPNVGESKRPIRSSRKSSAMR